MEFKHKVRERRHSRIKQLLGEPTAIPRSIILEEPQKPAYVIDHRLEDPEYVWKQQMRYDSIHSSNGTNSIMLFTFRFFKIQLLICLVIYALLWAGFHFRNPEIMRYSVLVKQAINQQMDITAIESWYNSNFSGFPSLIPAFGSQEGVKKTNGRVSQGLYPPVLGVITKAFGPKFQGVQLLTKEAAPIAAMDDGWVTFVGGNDADGYHITIRHSNQRETVYQEVGKTLVKLNDWVIGGQQIGTIATSGRLYFAVKKNDQYVNPTEVITFD
jgi:stage IV sporulation protein FA